MSYWCDIDMDMQDKYKLWDEMTAFLRGEQGYNFEHNVATLIKVMSECVQEFELQELKEQENE